MQESTPDEFGKQVSQALEKIKDGLDNKFHDLKIGKEDRPYEEIYGDVGTALKEAGVGPNQALKKLLGD